MDLNVGNIDWNEVMASTPLDPDDVPGLNRPEVLKAFRDMCQSVDAARAAQNMASTIAPTAALYVGDPNTTSFFRNKPTLVDNSHITFRSASSSNFVSTDMTYPVPGCQPAALSRDESEMVGAVVVQYCPRCRRHEKTSFLRARITPPEWRAPWVGPPEWPNERYHDFHCVAGHVFSLRCSTRSACADAAGP